MDIVSDDGDGGGVGAEGFVLDLAQIRSVQGVGVVCSESSQVEQVDAAANLLVGRKGHTQLAVGKFGMAQKPVHQGHDLGDARLVVGAQQRGAVGVDQGVSHAAGEIGLAVRGQARAGRGKNDVAASVGSDDLRADVRWPEVPG
jgi:hypothetical protein